MLREPLMAQLVVQAGWTYKVRLAPTFPPSALIRGSLADLLAHARTSLNSVQGCWRVPGLSINALFGRFVFDKQKGEQLSLLTFWDERLSA